MWLERLAGQSTQSSPGSASPSRSFSPAPLTRRPTQGSPLAIPHRPGLTPRTSSLGALLGTGSTDSLPPTAKVPHGTNLRRELNGSPTHEVQDPLAVLTSLLGTSGGHTTTPAKDGFSHGLGPDLVEDIDFRDLSLDEFVKTTTNTISATQEPPVIEDFEKEKERFEDLHGSIVNCDDILAEVEKYLASFQADLAAVSTEIESLQNRSSSLNSKLRNRKVVEKSLGAEVETFSISPAAVRRIINGPIDDAWLRSLEEFDKRAKSIDAKFKDEKILRAAEDMLPIINDISDKAVERIRDYVVAQIKALRSPNINAQVVQQTSFVKYRSVFAFLQHRQPQLAEEIIQAYVYTMRWYFISNFTRYKAAIEKLSIHHIEASETIAVDNPRRTAKAAAVHDAFSIGRRMQMLRSPTTTAFSSYIADESKETHYLETAFYTFNLALIDNASAEYSFLAEFFYKQPLSSTSRSFVEIWTPTFELGQAFTKQLVEQNQDAIGVLLCVRLNQKFAFELQRRKGAAVEGYTNAISMILWPRFQNIMDAHRESIKKLTASLPGKPTGSALTLTASPASAQSSAPHPLTQRFANFCHALLALSSDAGDDEPVAISLMRLRSEYEAFVIKLSKGITDAKKRERFLHNNYALVCTILGDVEGRMAEDMRGRFTVLRDDTAGTS